nr:single-stranded DNA-binding protein [Bacteroidia bacterium]
SASFKNKEGQKIETTEWHNVVVWHGLAEIVEKYVRKGKWIYIEGKIKTRQYGEENNKKYITEIVADEMTMLGGPRTDNPEPAASTQSTPEMAVTSAPSDDLPF